MKTVLLTGATGCIGRQAVKFLVERGYVVHAVSSGKELPENDSNLYWHHADLLNARQTGRLTEQIKATHLLHLAWYFGRDVYSSPLNFEWVKASFTLLENFVENGGRRVVSAGSCVEYSWTTEKIYREDETLLKPKSVYGRCKVASEILFETFVESRAISAAWGRIFFLYGPAERSNRVVPAVINALLKGEPALCSHGNQIKDYLYVEDVAEALVELLDGTVSGAVNIASGVPVTVKEIVLKTAEIIGRPDLIRLGAITPQAGEPPEIVASVKRLESEVGWKPKWTLDAGLEKTIDWWRENLR